MEDDPTRDVRIFPIDELPTGKAIGGYIIRCKRCLYTIVLRGRSTSQPRWWEKIGWGRIATTTHGAHNKGDLFCPNCIEIARQNSIGYLEGTSNG